MKNGLVIFIILLPLYLFHDFVFERQNTILQAFEFILPFTITSYFVRQKIGQFNREKIFKEIFRFTLVTGMFFAIWFGTYQYFITQFAIPEIFDAQIDLMINQLALGKSLTEAEIESVIQNARTPLNWILSALFLYSILFSLLGTIFGFLYKVKLSKS